jgi:hypothetical protein
MVGTAKHPERKQRDGQPDRKWFHEPPLHLRVKQRANFVINVSFVGIDTGGLHQT